MDSSVKALHNALCIMYHMVITESCKIWQILGIKCHNSEIVPSFCPETWYIIVRDTGESDGINHLSTTREPGKLKN
jgi:hypothetical protein